MDGRMYRHLQSTDKKEKKKMHLISTMLNVKC